MKKLTTVAVIILLSFSAYSQTSELGKEQKLKAELKTLVEDSFDDIWSALQSKNVEKYYTEDFLLLENGEVWNNDSIMNYLDIALYKKPTPKRVNKIDIIEVKLFEGMAWVAYHNYATFTIDGKVVRDAYWLESAHAVKVKGVWKFQMLHSTRVE